MTCSECNTTLPEDTATCGFCGAPVENPPTTAQPKVTSTTIEAPTTVLEVAGTTGEAQDSRRLWNPILIAVFELPLLGVVLASVLVALNWHRLNRPKFAWVTWGFAALVLLFDGYGHDGLTLLETQLYSFLVWLPLIALPQVLYFRKQLRTGYPRRRWLIPIGVGLILQFGFQLVNTYPKDHRDEVPTKIIGPSVKVEAPDFSVEEVARYVSPLVVPVKTSWMESSWLIFRQSRTSRGSGVYVLRDDGLVFIVTNRHVVDVPEGATDVRRTLILNQKEMPYEVAAYAKNNLDLAMLRLPDPEGKATSMVPFLTTDELSVGQDCIAIGNTLGAGISVTTGIISRFDNMGSFTAIRTSAPISPGNSGGGLFRRKDGRLIGITTLSSAEEHAQNVNIAIPMDYVLAKGALWEDLPATKH